MKISRRRLPDYVEILHQKKRAARAAGTLVAFFDEVWEMTTWYFQI